MFYTFAIASFVSPVGVALSGGQQQQRRTRPMAIDAAPTEYQEESAVDAARALLNRPFEREQLKGQLLRVCAACNRGFGASALDRASVDGILERLTPLSPTADPTAGMIGSAAKQWLPSPAVSVSMEAVCDLGSSVMSAERYWDLRLSPPPSPPTPTPT
mgnify:CR=1 FL=1